MENCIFGIASNPPQRGSSHTAGWVNKWQELLNADIVTDVELLKNYKNVYLYNDINNIDNKAIGKLNIFGFKLDNDIGIALQERIKGFSQAVNAYKLNVKQLDYPQLYKDALGKRGIEVSEAWNNIPHVEQHQYSTKVVVGDSHSTSIAKPGWAACRNDGMTLHGALKRGLVNLIPEDATEVAFQFGNIDLRHHLCRYELSGTMNLLREYRKQLGEVSDKGIKVTVTMPLPQTKDTRKIPKTGFFKGTAYYGDLEDRKANTVLLGSLIAQMGFPVIDMNRYLDDDGTLNEEFMEAGGSFHLAPHSYNWSW